MRRPWARVLHMLFTHNIIPLAVAPSICRFRKEGLDLIYLYSVFLFSNAPSLPQHGMVQRG